MKNKRVNINISEEDHEFLKKESKKMFGVKNVSRMIAWMIKQKEK